MHTKQRLNSIINLLEREKDNKFLILRKLDLKNFVKFEVAIVWRMGFGVWGLGFGVWGLG